MSAAQGFGPERRLKSRSDYLRVQQRGKKYRSPHFILAFLPPLDSFPPSSPGRIGVTVTTKVHKGAVKRNTIKRRVREIYRRECARPKNRADAVVIALNGAAELTFDECYDELMGLFGRARLLGTPKDGRS